MSNFMKIRPLGTDFFFHADRQTDDMTKLIAAFRNFTIAPKKSSVCQ